WQWGVTYTVRPHMLEPLGAGRDHKLFIVCRKKIASGEEFTDYGDLYRQGFMICEARGVELGGGGGGGGETWVGADDWFRHNAGPHELVGACITMGIACLDPEDTVPEGQLPPAPHQLRAPGGSQLREKAEASSREVPHFNLDETYSAFDFRDGASPHPD